MKLSQFSSSHVGEFNFIDSNIKQEMILMCDTFSVPARANGVTLFAKNSDRSPNEPLLTIHVPGQHHAAGAMAECTYIGIPQAEYTREMILCKPSWIWGAEMGVNEDRVAIGNEAVFTKSKTKRAPSALIGMDLLRLALERAGSAYRAVELMIELLEAHGQGGNCGFEKDFRYDNSFLVADPREVYILETSGKRYAVTLETSRCAISNRLGIKKDHIMRSGLKAGESFTKRFTEPVFSHFSRAKERRAQVMERLNPSMGAAALFQILRGHAAGAEGREFRRASVGSVCMHAGGPIGDHSTGSLAAVLREDRPVTLWCTGASTPCIAAYKPVFWGSGAPPVFAEEARSKAYWLRREHLHRAAIAGLIDVAALRNRIQSLEADWLRREEQIMGEDSPDIAALHALSRDAAAQEQALVEEFTSPDWRNIEGRGFYARYWRGKNAALEHA